MTPEERNAAAREIIAEIDWDEYDYTTAEGADMSFPDFDEDDMADLPVWVPKRFNKTGSWSMVHVPELNQIANGAERRLFALYGVPVEWPSDESEREDLFAELDSARESGGDSWAEAMDEHGLVNDEHYLWLRGRALGIPEEMKSYASAKKAIAAIDAAIAADTDIDETLGEYGLRDSLHYDYVKAAWSRASKKAWGKAQDVLAETFGLLDERFAANKAALSDELGPVQGVSLEAWAGANVRISQGRPVEDVIAEMGIERPQWDAVSAEWNARMSRDTTATIATVYGQAFMAGGQGKFAAAAAAVGGSMKAGFGKDVEAAEPLPFEQWVKIQSHVSAATAQGVDPGAVLAKYDLNAADFGTVGGYWALKMNAEPMKYIERYSALSEKYAAEFATAGAGSDIDL